MELNARQRAFVEAYCGNATEAALAAGYSKKTAAFIGAENLKKPQIAAAIKEREKKRLSPVIASREDRQKFWTDVLKSPDSDMKDRLRASELLAKSEGDFLERREVTGPNGAPLYAPPQIVINFVKPDEREDGKAD